MLGNLVILVGMQSPAEKLEKRFPGCGQGYLGARSRCFFLFLTLLCLPLLIVNSAAAAPAGKSNYLNARSYYFQIRREDPNVRDLLKWETAASNLLRYIERYPNSEYAPAAMYSLGRLYEQTYRKRQFRTGLSRAVYFYERVARDFKGHRLADDALLYLGDLRRQSLKDEPGARAAYYEIVDRYPRGDMLSQARSRLGLGNEPSKTKQGGEDSSAVKSLPKPVEQSVEPETAKESSGLFSFLGSIGKTEKSREVYASKVRRERPLIVIDPGHGGEDKGAVGVSRQLEKDIVLNISLYLDELLRENLRAETVLTRARDVTLELEDRTKLANEKDADLFISIHANASRRKTAKGMETYYLDNTNDKSSLKLAERENMSARVNLSDLSFMISDLIQNAKLDDSIALAHYVQSSMVDTVSRYYKGVKDLGVKKAPFYVLVGAHMPCVLVEVSFIDHPVEGRRLTQRRYQKLLAEAIYRGIRDYFEKR